MEELKVISDIIGGLSGNATSAFLFYLGYKVLGMAIGYSALFVILFLCYKLALQTLQNIRAREEDISLANDIAQWLGMSTPLYRPEKVRIKKAIEEALDHMAAHKREK